MAGGSVATDQLLVNGKAAEVPLPLEGATGVQQENSVVEIYAEGETVVQRNEDGEEEREAKIALGRNLDARRHPVIEHGGVMDDLVGDRKADISRVLEGYRKLIMERRKCHLGYPCTMDADFSALTQLQNIHINNAGDPFVEGTFAINSREFEVGVLDWFAHLWELERSQYWGYITHGGTEGNLHGILVGRELFPDGILYFSRDSHYSVFKAARMYRMECMKIDTLVSGEMDCADFRKKLHLNTHKPAILVVNVGTTMKGAIDDLDLILQILEESGFTNRFYIHCDGALFGVMVPFVKETSKITFRKAIGSISVSGHKFMGCPMPCGVQMTRLEHINALSRKVEYLDSMDATIVGSRSGHAPIFLWYFLSCNGYAGMERLVHTCLHNARYLRDRLQAAGIGAMLNGHSNTVVFERPRDDDFIRWWQLACEGNLAHIVVMPHVDTDKIDMFLDDLVTKRASWYATGEAQPPCLAPDIGSGNCRCSSHRF